MEKPMKTPAAASVAPEPLPDSAEAQPAMQLPEKAGGLNRTA
jgi:hypothetical protein